MLRTDGRLEDEGDFNDFYIQPTDDMDFTEQKELQELQDEELARLLQDQEKKVSSTHTLNRLPRSLNTTKVSEQLWSASIALLCNCTFYDTVRKCPCRVVVVVYFQDFAV